MPDMQGNTKETLIRRLLVSRMGIEPGLLRHAAPRLAGKYDSQWAPVERLATYLELLPAGMLRFLSDHPRGYLVVSAQSGYVAGEVSIGERVHTNVVSVSLHDLESPLACISVVAQLLDHLLGCNGEPAGEWLSDGGGITPELVRVGEEINQLFRLGYGIDEESTQNAHAYLARSLAWYIEDRRALNVADPRVERLLKRTLMSEPFWDQIDIT